jgi:hypothetical protein
LTLLVGSIQNVPADVLYYTATPVEAQYIEQNKIESLEEQIDRIAIAHGIATTTLYNLALSESSLGVKREGDGGKSCGVVHFHKDYYPLENSRCDDDEYILNRAAEMIATDEGWKFVPCNCYAYAEVLTSYKLPRNIEIVPNEAYPKVGGLVILRYTNNKHIVVVTKVTEEGIWIREANFKPCALGSRLLDWNDPRIKGYWAPLGG